MKKKKLIGRTHDKNCPALRNERLAGEAKLWGVTFGQEGCPFCSFSRRVEGHPDEIKRLIRRQR